MGLFGVSDYVGMRGCGTNQGCRVTVYEFRNLDTRVLEGMSVA